jgi:flagellar biosynthesis/type III secretory pathway protein FliH
LDNKHVSDTARSPAVDSPASSFVTSIPTSGEDVQAQLAAAKEKIAQLTQKVSEQSELRRRKGAEVLEQKGFPNAAQALANPQSAGIPLKWVAILTFFAFLVGWLVF